MRIVHLVAGAGGTYCGACAHDAALLSGLAREGHDIDVVQLYTPIRPDSDDPFGEQPVYFGGITVSVEQVWPGFGDLAPWLIRPLDSPGLLRWVSRLVKTNPESLGPMTVSMLRGAQGRQRSEIRKLLVRLKQGSRPDVIVITNSLLSGLASSIKEQMDVPVLCGVMGEDSFVDSLPERYRLQARGLIRKNAESIDLFVSPSAAYADEIASFVGVPRSRVAVAQSGLNPAKFQRDGNWQRSPGPFVIGCLSSIRREKGLDLLVEACHRLKEEGSRDFTLRIAGRILDDKYWRKIERDVRTFGLEGSVVNLGELPFAQKVDFLHGLNVFCLPSRLSESRGVAAMEAMAAGVPVILPSRGVFPEMIARTGGGLLFHRENPGEIAEHVRALMGDAAERERLGAEAAKGIAKEYPVRAMVDSALAAYELAVTNAKATVSAKVEAS